MGEKGQNAHDDDPNFNRRIITLMKKENLAKSKFSTPILMRVSFRFFRANFYFYSRTSIGFEFLVQDVNNRLDELGNEGITDPFESIYAIVFR